MRVKLAIGCVVLAALGCSSSDTTPTGTGGAGGSSVPCTDPFLEVNGDGLAQRFTAVSGKEAGGTLELEGSGDAPSTTSIHITTDKLTSTALGKLEYDRGAQQLDGDHATVTITSLGAVGESIEGSYAGSVMPVTVGITLSLSGSFKVCRDADGTK
jgi:hypothetical protein